MNLTSDTAASYISQEMMNLDSGLLLPNVCNPILLNTPSCHTQP